MATQTSSPEFTENVSSIVRQDLAHITKQGIAITDVRVNYHEDPDVGPYHHIVIVYSGDDDLLEPKWLNGFKRRNRDALDQLGIHVTVESYVEESEDHEWRQMQDHEDYEEWG